MVLSFSAYCFAAQATPLSGTLSLLCSNGGAGINYSNHFEVAGEKYSKISDVKEDVRIIGRAGFSLVRVPVAWGEHLGQAPSYLIDPSFFKDVDQYVEAIVSSGMVVVLNLHRFDIRRYSEEDGRRRFASIWSQVSERYAKYDRGVVFELYNEPDHRVSNSRLGELYREVIPIVRSASPNREIIVSANKWSKIEGLSGFDFPKFEGLYLSLHYYAPAKFTHQGASWIKGADQWRGAEWGSDADHKSVAIDFDLAESWVQGKVVSGVFLGEFGVVRNAHRSSRLRWVDAVRKEAVARGWCWAYWEFKAGFGVFDAGNRTWDSALLKSLGL